MQDTLFIYRRRRIFKHTMIRVQTPIRIDLAGGTLDLFPIHQFVYPETFSTINVAISLYNQVDISKLPTSNIIITSSDLNITIEFDNRNHLLDEIKKVENPLMIAMKAVYYFKIESIKVSLISQAPKGSGLGNSSSLLVAVVGGLNEFTKRGYSKQKIIEIAQGIETSILKIPTGTQDYIAAMYGGVNKIRHELIGSAIVPQNNDIIFDKFIDNALLCYVEEPKRFSSALENPNWDIFKRAVEQNESTLANLRAINNVANTMSEAIENNNWSQFVSCINKETEIRSMLSDTIISSKMSNLIYTLKKNKIEGFKICGAGGGGCILILSELKDQLITELNSMSYQILEFSLDTVGFQILN